MLGVKRKEGEEGAERRECGAGGVLGCFGVSADDRDEWPQRQLPPSSYAPPVAGAGHLQMRLAQTAASLWRRCLRTPLARDSPARPCAAEQTPQQRRPVAPPLARRPARVPGFDAPPAAADGRARGPPAYRRAVGTRARRTPTRLGRGWLAARRTRAGRKVDAARGPRRTAAGRRGTHCLVAGGTGPVWLSGAGRRRGADRRCDDRDGACRRRVAVGRHAAPLPRAWHRTTVGVRWRPPRSLGGARVWERCRAGGARPRSGAPRFSRPARVPSQWRRSAGGSTSGQRSRGWCCRPSNRRHCSNH